MAATLKLGDRKWATKEGSLLAYNDENNNYKPLPFDFTRASSATRVNKQGLIETVASGVPRIDFTDANGALLLEPQRTNKITNSENFSAWSVSSNAILTYESDVISPDGTSGVYRLNLPATSATFISSNAISISSVGTFSCYVKSANTGNNDFGFYKGAGSIPSPFTATNEWQRFELDVDSSTVNMAIINGADTFASDIYIWGAQAEEGSYATSYIPTQGSTVTRIDDACTGAGNDQVFNSAEGVLYAEMSALADDFVDKRITISNGSVNNYVTIGYSRFSGNIISEMYSGGVLQTINWGATGVTKTNNNKFAFSWGNGTMKFYVNGTQTNTESVTSPTGLNILDLSLWNNTQKMEANIKDLRVYNTALTDAELIALTT